MTEGRAGRAIQIVEPELGWAEDFQSVARALRGAFGKRALRIDHIGSTAVPGLAAKPIVDVQVTVRDLDGASEALQSAGFSMTDIRRDDRPVGFSLEESHLEKLVATSRGSMSANVHVRVDDRFNQRYALLMRDYFRSHPRIAQAYGELKRNLARIVGDVDAYYAVKGPVFDIVHVAAEEWAEQTDWRPGTSDA